MPRDIGTGLYHYPDGTPGNPGQTIFSTRYNTFINDLTNTLNQALPVNMGGTGGDNPTTARANLKAETAMQTVTNYDTHVWENGSFWSAAGATGAPEPGGTYGGIAYVTNNDPNYITVEATNTGNAIKFIRQKNVGVWGPWKYPQDETFVNQAGDTMTGPLAISYSSPILIINKASTATGNWIVGQNAGVSRWNIRPGNGGGDDFLIDRVADDGTTTFIAMQISRATGNISVPANIVAAGFGCAGTTYGNGTIELGNPATAQSVFIDFHTKGTNTDFDARILCDGSGNLNVTANVAIFSNQLNCVDVFCRNITSTGSISCIGYATRAGTPGPNDGHQFNFAWPGAGLNAWMDNVNLGFVNITSDYRIKKDVKDLPGTWETVKALRPIKYTQAQYSPTVWVEKKIQDEKAEREKAVAEGREPKPAEAVGPLFPADNIERWGFIAHELQATLVPSAATGVKDDPVVVQSPNPWTVIAALTKALQEAMARIEALEAAQAPP